MKVIAKHFGSHLPELPDFSIQQQRPNALLISKVQALEAGAATLRGGRPICSALIRIATFVQTFLVLLRELCLVRVHQTFVHRWI